MKFYLILLLTATAIGCTKKAKGTSQIKSADAGSAAATKATPTPVASTANVLKPGGVAVDDYLFPTFKGEAWFKFNKASGGIEYTYKWDDYNLTIKRQENDGAKAYEAAEEIFLVHGNSKRMTPKWIDLPFSIVAGDPFPYPTQGWKVTDTHKTMNLRIKRGSSLDSADQAAPTNLKAECLELYHEETLLGSLMKFTRVYCKGIGLAYVNTITKNGPVEEMLDRIIDRGPAPH